MAVKEVCASSPQELQRLAFEVMGHLRTAQSPVTHRLHMAGVRAWVEHEDGQPLLVAHIVMERAKESLYHAIK